MRRRHLLRSTLVGPPLLAGCLGLSDGGSPTPRPSVSVVDRLDRPDIPVRPDIELVTAAASDAGPPVLRATVENTADHPIEVGEERAIVFAYVASQPDRGLTLVPADESYDPVRTGCWRLAEQIAVPEYYGIVSLDPGETTERRLNVWGSPDGEGCLPAGEFRFLTQYAGARDRGDGIEDQEWAGEWGFTLAVE